MSQPAEKWYRRYPAVLEELDGLRRRFVSRCEELKQPPEVISLAFRWDFLSRAVHESNWQEGIELDIGRTTELAALAADDLRFTDGSRLDLEQIVASHRESILALKKRKASVEELAALNLARAHTVLAWIQDELSDRQFAAVAQALKHVYEHLNANPEIRGRLTHDKIMDGIRSLDVLVDSDLPLRRPLTGSFEAEGALMRALLQSDTESLLRPFDERYLHALHRLCMMGIAKSSDLGHWRRGSVHVGNPNLAFPPAEAVPALIREFLREFPPVSKHSSYEPIMAAARWSYRFVRIHPYSDGNGRMSRLIMNLLLLRSCPVLVSLAPRAKERHRYRQALHRADRGQIDALASLIGISVCDAYKKLLSALERPYENPIMKEISKYPPGKRPSLTFRVSFQPRDEK